MTHPGLGFARQLVAIMSDAGRETCINEARYAVLDESPAERKFALGVAARWQGQGVGSRLLRNLTRHADCRNVARLHGEVLRNTMPMLELTDSPPVVRIAPASCRRATAGRPRDVERPVSAARGFAIDESAARGRGFQLKPDPGVLQRARNCTARRSDPFNPSRSDTMTPSSPTSRPLVSPTHFTLAVAAAAVISSVCMAVGDPFAATIPTAAVALATLDRDDAGAGDLPEATSQACRPRWLVQ